MLSNAASMSWCMKVNRNWEQTNSSKIFITFYLIFYKILLFNTISFKKYYYFHFKEIKNNTLIKFSEKIERPKNYSIKI